jgi:2-amino-4-hydroxy-6-hydroxymethyldihydropteridine diphosphokinase
MTEFHHAHLSLGSNIEPEANLPKAVDMLSRLGTVVKRSGVWESEPVGTAGANYLNLCLLYKSVHSRESLKGDVIQVIETRLGRNRTDDKFAPRTMDIDVILFDWEPIDTDWLKLAYVVVPLAEIYPDFKNPITGETLEETATRLRREVWLEARRGIQG